MVEAAARETWMVGPPGRTTVAERDGAIVATANMYANRSGPGDHVASGSFMVDPAQWSQGAGRALVQDMLAWAKQEGFKAVQFNAVAETNERAIALYRDLGFETVGTVPGAFRHPTRGYVGLCVMYRPL
jgi:GNAT superfamily N-acetyltransferase